MNIKDQRPKQFLLYYFWMFFLDLILLAPKRSNTPHTPPMPKHRTIPEHGKQPIDVARPDSLTSKESDSDWLALKQPSGL